MILAVLVMLLSSALYAPALVLQHKGTQQSIGQFSSGQPKFLDLLKNRVWLSGLILFYVAAVVHIVAISLGSLAVVQPLIVTELIFVPIAAMIISKTAVPGQALGMGNVGYRVPAEFNKNLIHKRGVLAAARDNNPAKASSGCQFYITQGKKYSRAELQLLATRTGNSWTEEQLKIYEEVGGTPMLDMNYTVFGEVVSGLDVIDKIIVEPRDQNDRPYKDIRMKVKVVE